MNKMNNRLNSRHCYFHLTSKIRIKEKVVLHKICRLKGEAARNFFSGFVWTLTYIIKFIPMEGLRK